MTSHSKIDRYPSFNKVLNTHTIEGTIDYCLDLILEMRVVRGDQYIYNGCIETLKICAWKLNNK